MQIRQQKRAEALLRKSAVAQRTKTANGPETQKGADPRPAPHMEEWLFRFGTTPAPQRNSPITENVSSYAISIQNFRY